MSNKQGSDNQIELDDGESMILEEEIDENYEPTQEEIVEYAEFLGMNIQDDKEFFYIAREGLKAPLPETWKPAKNRNGDIYYINLTTKKSQWEHPCDEHYKKLFQEAKKKKDKNSNQKQLTNKFKNNFAIAANSFSPKAQILPVIKEYAETNNHDDKESSASSENSKGLLAARDDDSFIANATDNFYKKKITEKSNSPKLNGFNSILSELKEDTGSEEFTKVDKEYLEKVIVYSKEKETEFKELKSKQKEVENNINKESKTELTKYLEKLKDTLINKADSSKQSFLDEKIRLRKDLINEYQKQTEKALKKEDQQDMITKERLERKEANELEKIIKELEERVIEEHEEKIIELAKIKKKIDSERIFMKQKDQQNEIELTREFEKMKETIAEAFKEKLENFEMYEVQNQHKEIDNFKNELKLKINEEKLTISIAQKQSRSLNKTKQSELREIYEKQYEREKNKIDNENTTNIKTFEENEKIKKEKAIQNLQVMELEIEKDKKKLQVRAEIEKIKDNYQRRLAPFEAQNKERLENEKKLIDQEVTNILERHRCDVEDIRVNLTTKEDILGQIGKSQQKNQVLSEELENLDEKISTQKLENQRLHSKINELINEKKNKTYFSITRTITEIEQNIREADMKLASFMTTPPRKAKDFFINPKIRKISPSASANHKSFPIVRIVEDIQEIKSIMVNSDEKEKMHSSLSLKRNKLANLLSPQSSNSRMLTSSINVKTTGSSYEASYFSNKLRSDTKQDMQEKWMEIYIAELSKISELKETLGTCKKILLKKQQSLAQSQEDFRVALLEYRNSTDRTVKRKRFLKTLKQDLSDKITKLNETMHNIREADSLYDDKEKLLERLGRAVRRLDVDDINIEKLESLYRRYLRINVQVPSLDGNRYNDVYQNWEGLLENQQNIDNELSESEDTSEVRSKIVSREERDFHSERKNLPYANKVFEPRASLESPGSLQYSYSDLFKMLEFQTRSNTPQTESTLIQRHFTEGQEDRSRFNTILGNHSAWLRDVKEKLNQQLYDKPIASSSRDVMVSKNGIF